MEYTKPEIVDYGTLAELTAATQQGPTEDGGDKHHEPSNTTHPGHG
jgi:hypothetical protein